MCNIARRATGALGPQNGFGARVLLTDGTTECQKHIDKLGPRCYLVRNLPESSGAFDDSSSSTY